MAKRAAPAEPADKELTLPEIRLAIRRLERRVADLEAFDPTQVGTQRAPKILDLEAAIKETLSDIFGYNTHSYRTYMAAAALGTAGMNSNGAPLHEVIEGLVRGKERSLSLLRRAARSFQEKIEDDPDYHNARAGTAMAGAAMAGYGGARAGDSPIAPVSAEVNASIGEFSNLAQRRGQAADRAGRTDPHYLDLCLTPASCHSTPAGGCCRPRAQWRAA